MNTKTTTIRDLYQRKHLFSRPYLAHEVPIDDGRTNSKIFKKRHYKYIHQVYSFSSCKSQFLKSISKIKTLHAFALEAPNSRKIPVLQKLVKPHQKSLTKVRFSLHNPKVLKLLPRLARFDLDLLLPSSCKLSRRFRKLSHLYFHLDSKGHNNLQQEKTNCLNLIHKYSAGLCRNLCKIKTFKRLSGKSSFHYLDLFVLMARRFDQKGLLKSLEHFHLDLAKPSEAALGIDSSGLGSFLSLTEITENLTSLNLVLAPREESWNSSSLSQLQALQKLKNLRLCFVANSSTFEREFLENLRIPSSVESLHFDLKNFAWTRIDRPLIENNSEMIHNHFSTDPIYTSFFETFKNHQNVKSLSLFITNNFPKLPGLADTFTSLFISQFTQLQKIHYRYNSLVRAINGTSLSQPLDLKTFWKGLIPSKETLESISITLPAIKCVSPLENKFPKLRNLTLGSKVFWTSDLGCVRHGISNLKEFSVSEIELKNEKELKEFFHDLRKVPKGMKVSLRVKVEGIQDEVFIEKMRKYIGKGNIQGGLMIEIMKNGIEDMKNFREVVELAVQKGCFETLDLRNLQDNKYIFRIQRKTFSLNSV